MISVSSWFWCLPFSVLAAASAVDWGEVTVDEDSSFLLQINMTFSEASPQAARPKRLSFGFPSSVDLVYLYVNGSDLEYQRSRLEAWKQISSMENQEHMTQAPNNGDPVNSTALSRDSGELLFSLRSMTKFFRSKVRKVFLVTESPPAWLNQQVLISGELEVVHPSKILPPGTFPNFNSRAIESNLHKIAGLGDYYMTLNDDVYLGRPVSFDDFFQQGALKIHMDMNTRYNIDAANNENELTPTWNSHRQAMKNANQLLDLRFGHRSDRAIISHSPLFWSKALVADAHSIFREALDNTSTHIFRSMHDVHPAFLYSHYMRENSSIMAEIEDSEESLIIFPQGASKFSWMVSRGVEELPRYFSVNNHMEQADEEKFAGWIQGGLHTLFPDSSRYEDVTLHHLDEPPSQSMLNELHYQEQERDSLGKQTLVCCLVASAAVSFTILANHMWNALIEGSSQDSLERNGDRTFLLDNAKAFAMMLVIFGHILHNSENPESIMQGRPWEVLFFGTKMIQMPMFCLVSGLCSQQPPTAKRVRSLITHIALPAVIQICVICPLLLRIWQTPNYMYRDVSDFVNGSYFFSPLFLEHMPWYLVALVLWRSLAFICSTYLSSSSALVTLMLISCIGGYLPAGSSVAMMWTHEAIGFLPYFAIGYVLPFNAIMKKASIVPMWTRFVAAVCVLLWIVGIVAPNVFHSHLPDAHKQYRFPPSMSNRDIRLFWTWRLTKVVVDIVPCLIVLVFVMPRGKTFLTQAGQYSLYAYLHHRPIVNWYCKMLYALQNSVVWLQLSVCGGLLLVAMCHLVISMAVMLFLTSWPWRRLFSWAVEPTWANPFMERLIPDAETGK